MDFSATSVKTCPMFDSGSGYSAEVTLYDKDGKFIDHFSAGAPNETNHLLLTMNPGRYYLKVGLYECTGDRYSFRIDPAAAITANRECGEAIVTRDAVSPELAAAKKELAENTEELAAKTRTLKAAKKQLHRLKRRRATTRWQKRQVRRRLELAKDARATVLEARAGVKGVIAQDKQVIASAEGQIAAHC